MLSNTYTKLRNLWKKFADRDYRRAFVASNISTTITAQIETMRLDRGWTQTQLAEAAGMKQSRISALEDPSSGLPTVTTLLKIADAYDVGVIVQFVPFSRLAGWATGASGETFSVPSFSNDGIGLSQMNTFLNVTTKGSGAVNLIEAKAVSEPLRQYFAKTLDFTETHGEPIYAH